MASCSAVLRVFVTLFENGRAAPRRGAVMEAGCFSPGIRGETGTRRPGGARWPSGPAGQRLTTPLRGACGPRRLAPGLKPRPSPPGPCRGRRRRGFAANHESGIQNHEFNGNGELRRRSGRGGWFEDRGAGLVLSQQGRRSFSRPSERLQDDIPAVLRQPGRRNGRRRAGAGARVRARGQVSMSYRRTASA